MLNVESILHLHATHVGDPCARYPLKESDWINFAHAIESAATAPLLARIAELETKLANAESGWAAASQTILRMETSDVANHAGDAWAVADGLTRDNRNLRAQLKYANEVIEQRNAMLSDVYSDIGTSILVPKRLFAQALNAIGLPASPELTRIREDLQALLAKQTSVSNPVDGPDDHRYILKA